MEFTSNEQSGFTDIVRELDKRGIAVITKNTSIEGFVSFVGFVKPNTNKLCVFNSNILPIILRDYAKSITESIQVPDDMASVSLITISALSVQGKYVINPLPGWMEPLNLYTVIIARPSERKSPVIREVTDIIYKYVDEVNENRAPAIIEYNTKKDLLIRRIDSYKKTASNVKKNKSKIDTELDIHEITHMQLELDSLEEIAPLRVMADDVTPEALISLLCQNNGVMSIVSAEGGIFDIVSGRYSNKVNIDVFLKAYSGDPIQIDRKGRTSEYIKDPALTMLLAVQPSVIEDIMSNKEMNGRGLLARFLYSLPVSRIGERRYKVKPIPEEVKKAYDDLIHRLLSIPMPEKPEVIRLSKEADSLAEEFFKEIEIGLTDELQEIEGWSGKLHGQTMRIAGVFHCIKHIEQSANVLLEGETMKQAIEVGKYFLEHAKVAFSIMGLSDPQEVKDAKYILKRLDSTGNHEISKRDLFVLCRGKAGFEKVEDMDSGLNELVQHGYIRIYKKYPNSQNPQNSQKVGGRPTEVIEINPEYEKYKEGEKSNGLCNAELN